MLNEENYKQLIAKSLYENNLINEEIYEKCSKPKYIQDLPGDLRTTDVDELRERLGAVQDLQKETDEEYKNLMDELDDIESEREETDIKFHEELNKWKKDVAIEYDMRMSDLLGTLEFYEENNILGQEELEIYYQNISSSDDNLFKHNNYNEVTGFNNDKIKDMENIIFDSHEFADSLRHPSFREEFEENPDWDNDYDVDDLARNLDREGDLTEQFLNDNRNGAKEIHENYEKQQNEISENREKIENKLRKHDKKVTNINDEEARILNKLDELGAS